MHTLKNYIELRLAERKRFLTLSGLCHYLNITVEEAATLVSKHNLKPELVSMCPLCQEEHDTSKDFFMKDPPTEVQRYCLICDQTVVLPYKDVYVRFIILERIR